MNRDHCMNRILCEVFGELYMWKLKGRLLIWATGTIMCLWCEVTNGRKYFCWWHKRANITMLFPQKKYIYYFIVFGGILATEGVATPSSSWLHFTAQQITLFYFLKKKVLYGFSISNALKNCSCSTHCNFSMPSQMPNPRSCNFDCYLLKI